MNHGVVILCSAWHNEILWQIPYNLPMKMKLTYYLAAFIVLAAGFGAWSLFGKPSQGINDKAIWEIADSEGEGNDLVKQAVRAVAEAPAFEADINCVFHVYGTEIHAPGRYYQQGQGTGKVRLYLKASIDGQLASLLRVSDGRFLYSRIDLPDEQRVTRVDMQKVNDELSLRLNRPTTLWNGDLMIGGLAYLLTRLDEDFAFDAPVADSLGDVPIWRLRGVWKAKAIRQMVYMQTGQGGDLENPFELLPTHVPTQIELICARDTKPNLFPYQIRFLGQPKLELLDTIKETARANEGEFVEPDRELIASIEFQRVVLNADLDASLFQYDAGEDEIEYRTEEHVADLKARFPDVVGGDLPNSPAIPVTR